MAIEIPGAPACPECGCIALCLNCNDSMRVAIAAAKGEERERIAKLIMDISPPSEWAFAHVLVKAIRTPRAPETKK